MKDAKLRAKYYSMNCAACGKSGCDPAHIRTYAASREDSDMNMMPLCRQHHTEQHQLGWKRMAAKYINVLVALDGRGWTLDDRGKLILK